MTIWFPNASPKLCFFYQALIFGQLIYSQFTNQYNIKMLRGKSLLQFAPLVQFSSTLIGRDSY